MTTTQIAPFDELTAALRGEVITPADPRYDEVRAVYNGMIDKRPAAIARCRDVADVLACVRFGREYDVTLSVRSGGHSAGGLGVWNDALVVDLSLMRSTPVDPEHRTVRVDLKDKFVSLQTAKDERFSFAYEDVLGFKVSAAATAKERSAGFGR